jgi:hypothetical protein
MKPPLRIDEGESMNKDAVLYTAVYSTKEAALDDLASFDQMHEDDLIGKYDAAVIDNENGKVRIVKRVDRPRIDVIPELVGGGELARKELKQAATELSPGQAAVVVVGEPTIEKAFGDAVRRADKTAKQEFGQSTDALADALLAATKS